MPEQEESTPQPAAIPPIIDPDCFEDYPAFRETFLLYFSDPEANATLGSLGELLYGFVLGYWQHWPDQPERLLRAFSGPPWRTCATSGFLAEWASGETSQPSPHEEHLATVGGVVAHD